MHFILREPLMTLISDLIAANQRISKVRYISLIATAFLALAILLQSINYSAAKQFENPELWTVNMKKQCDQDYSGQKWQDHALTSFGSHV